MRHLCRSESWCPQQKKSAEKLSGKSDLCNRCRINSRYYFNIVRAGIFVTFYVIDAGMERIGIMWFSFAVAPLMDCTISASRGIGKSLVPTIIVIMGSCVFRVIWVYTIFAYFHTIPSLYLLYIFSWFITALAEIIYFIHSYRKITF